MNFPKIYSIGEGQYFFDPLCMERVQEKIIKILFQGEHDGEMEFVAHVRIIPVEDPHVLAAVKARQEKRKEAEEASGLTQLKKDHVVLKKDYRKLLIFLMLLLAFHVIMPCFTWNRVYISKEEYREWEMRDSLKNQLHEVAVK